METIYITQISVEDIETISCLSSGKGVKAETWVLIAALGEAGGVEVGGLHWVTESDFLPWVGKLPLLLPEPRGTSLPVLTSFPLGSFLLVGLPFS